MVALAEHLGETLFERRDRAIVRKVRRVLAAFRPMSGDAEGFADFFRCALGDGFFAEFGIDVATMFHGASTTASAGGSAVADCFDKLTTDALVSDFLVIDVELEERHRALDIDSDGAGVDVGGRGHHATNRRTVSEVSIGVENNLGDAGRGFAVLDLLDGGVAEGLADCFISDHRDRFALGIVSRNEGS